MSGVFFCDKCSNLYDIGQDKNGNDIFICNSCGDNKKIESTDVVTNKRNQTLYAHYSINSYVIKYDYNYLKDNLYKDLDNKEYWNQDYEILLDEELFLNQNQQLTIKSRAFLKN